MSRKPNFNPMPSSSSETSQQSKNSNVAKSKSNSGLPTFLKWFKKSDSKNSSQTNNCAGLSSISSQLSSSQDSLSGATNTNFNLSLSQATSSDSLLSTATTGFAFIQPNNYEPTDSSFTKVHLVQNGEETDSLLRRVRILNNCPKKPNITLGEKYCLYESDTLQSNYNKSHSEAENYENLDFNERSLPLIRKQQKEITCSPRTRRKSFRRTVSDSSKDKKAGAYLHVKGKRKAPPPPATKIEEVPIPEALNNTQFDNMTDEGNENAASSETTLSRKKRRAPPPPPETDAEICNSVDESIKCSPRPWYKRSVASNRNSDIPYKREVILKTMEKRKRKNKDSAPSLLPDCGNSRASIFDHSSKLSFLLRNKADKKQLEKEKRRSNITIPNISELDREAADLVQKASDSSTKDLSTSLTNDLILQQEMFQKASNKAEDEESSPSTKDLIAKFETSDKIQVNHPKVDGLTTMTWVCPYCTLENPSWRIICEVCERLKPFENIGEKPKSSDEINKKESSELKLSNNWEMKAEIMKKYFKINDPSSSPKLDKRKETKNTKAPLLNSSDVVTTTVTTVFYAESVPPAVNEREDSIMPSKINSTDDEGKKEIDIEEIRSARLTKFQQKAEEKKEDIDLESPNSLEEERKRLREKIRAMNAKALAEKYPIIKKNISVEENSDTELKPTISTGAIPKKLTNGDISKPNNLGAVRKSQNAPPKPKKVSSSAQTSRMIKRHIVFNNSDILLDTPPTTSSNSSKSSSISPCKLSSNSSPRNSSDDGTDVDHISEQLNSVQAGLKGLQENLRNPSTKSRYNISKTDTITLNKIMRNLESAIADGEYDVAANLAMDLAKMKVNLQVTKIKNSTTALNDVGTPVETNKEQDEEILVRVFVEGFTTKSDETEFFVKPLMTIRDLKEKASKELKIPIISQKWLVNDNIAGKDNSTLADLGVSMEKNNVLFLSRFRAPIFKAPPPKLIAVKPIKAQPEDDYLSDTSSQDGDNGVQGAVALPLLRKKEVAEKRNDLNKINSNRKSSELFNIIEVKPVQLPRIVNETKKKVPIANNFSSPNITKSKYRGVDNFNPSVAVIAENKVAPESQSKDEILPSPYTNNHYLELIKLDTSEVVSNIEQFECPVCFMEIKPKEGALLRDCLHSFCRECLANTIKFCEEAEVKCPFMNSEYSCESRLQEREIKSLVTPEMYEKHLAKSVREAQHKIENAFHCKTPNCRGWCIFEDNVNQFKCPVCQITNCLTCRVIHDGLTCKQYQDRLKNDCDSNIEARRTRDMLQEMVEKGEAMNCPTCQVIMMKKWGCDWLKCSMCKTEVCWVTRGPRWGPAGKGDVTGGCKCGVNGIKCHPKCNYCH